MKQTFKLNVVGSDTSGNLLFCTFKIGKDTICRGFYSFLEEKFHVVKLNYNTLKENGINISTAINSLKKTLQYNYDWDLFEKKKNKK